MNKVKILLFASLRDHVGAQSLQWEVPAGLTIGELKTRLIKTYPILAPLEQSMMAAVNREYAEDGQALPIDAEIAFFPPVSGG
jgi:sulfur-carrier protein